MSIPPPDERYTWPTAPAGARGLRRQVAVRRNDTGLRTRNPAPTRRQGAFAGTVFAVFAVWGTVFRGIELPEGFALLGVGIVGAAVATSAVRLRPFAQGFLVASLVAGPVAVALLMMLLIALFANMGP